MLTFTFSGCASLQKNSPEDALKTRVEAFMNAKIAGDWEKAYSYFESSYRERVSKENYVRRAAAVVIKKFSIESIEIDPTGKKATVMIKSDITMQGLEFKDNVSTKKWVKEGSTWYLQMTHPDKNPLI